jgi:hypothetical protein
LENTEIETLVGVGDKGNNALDTGEDKTECRLGGGESAANGVVDLIVGP